MRFPNSCLPPSSGEAPPRAPLTGRPPKPGAGPPSCQLTQHHPSDRSAVSVSECERVCRGSRAGHGFRAGCERTDPGCHRFPRGRRGRGGEKTRHRHRGSAHSVQPHVCSHTHTGVHRRVSAHASRVRVPALRRSSGTRRPGPRLRSRLRRVTSSLCQACTGQDTAVSKRGAAAERGRHKARLASSASRTQPPPPPLPGSPSHGPSCPDWAQACRPPLLPGLGFPSSGRLLPLC